MTPTSGDETPEQIAVTRKRGFILAKYVIRMEATTTRCRELLKLHHALPDKASRAQRQDLLRAVAVLTHASLEDFLRTVGQSRLPYASRDALENVPFYVNGKLLPKVSVGFLANHRSTSIQDLIDQTVKEHLARTSFSSTSEIVAFLKEIEIDLSGSVSLPHIDALIRRRHQIVHRADLPSDDSHVPEELMAATVQEWLNAVVRLMMEVAAIVATEITSPRVLPDESK